MFVAAALGVLVAAIAIAWLGLIAAGGPDGLQRWLTAATPWFVLWRLVLYVTAGTLYLTRWRPRLLALQRTQSDGGAPARHRLMRVERLLVVAVVAIEATNMPDVIGWISGG